MDEDEIKGFWENLPMLREPLSSVFKVLLLLGQRKGETCRMKWNDIEDGIWTIPKDETKANRKHLVPLPPLAVEIIEDLENDSPFVFESRINKGKPVKWINEAFDRVTGEAKITDARIHDLRRTCATHLSGLGTDRTTLGKLLNHKGLSGDSQVTARYDRYGYMDEKRTALNKWSIGLYGIIKEADYNSLQKGFNEGIRLDLLRTAIDEKVSLKKLVTGIVDNDVSPERMLQHLLNEGTETNVTKIA